MRRLLLWLDRLRWALKREGCVLFGHEDVAAWAGLPGYFCRHCLEPYPLDPGSLEASLEASFVEIDRLVKELVWETINTPLGDISLRIWSDTYGLGKDPKISVDKPPQPR